MWVGFCNSYFIGFLIFDLKNSNVLFRVFPYISGFISFLTWTYFCACSSVFMHFAYSQHTHWSRTAHAIATHCKLPPCANDSAVGESPNMPTISAILILKTNHCSRFHIFALCSVSFRLTVMCLNGTRDVTSTICDDVLRNWIRFPLATFKPCREIQG